MIFKKTIFIISFLAMFGFLFNFGLPNAKAITVAEIEDLIAQLQQQITDLQQQLAQQQLTEEWCHDFNVNLRYGDTGSEVEALQIALEKEALYQREINQSSNFDELVASTVTGFQEKYKEDVLTFWGLSSGTGYVGNTTRAKLNELYGCGGKEADYSDQEDFSDNNSTIPGSKENLFPVIDGLEAPILLRVDREGTCQLKVNEVGSWTIRASDPESGLLTYSIDWGDGYKNEQQAERTATFTHSYNKIGTYTIEFVVSDGQQQETKVSIIVKVVSEIDYTLPISLSNSFANKKDNNGSVTGGKVEPKDVVLSGDWEKMVNNLYQKFPGASEYIGKIEYYLKDAIADQLNSTDGKIAEDTTAYRGALGMMSVLQSFETVKAAGYEGGFDDFTGSCFGYSHLKADIYKIIDGVPTVVPGSRVYDRATKTWYVWEDWSGSARVASETETRAFTMIDNQVSDAGDDELNMISTKEMHIRSLNEMIEKYENRIEITRSGGRVSDTWGDIEYLQEHIDQWKEDIAGYEVERTDWEKELADILGMDLNEIIDILKTPVDIEEDYVSPISDSDEFWNLKDSGDFTKDYDGNNGEEDNSYFPATPGKTGGVPSDEYKEFWNAVDPVFNYLDDSSYNDSALQAFYADKVKEFPWMADILGIDIEDVEYNPSFSNSDYWRNEAYGSNNNDNNDNNGYPATPGKTGGVPSDEYKEFWNAVDPVSDYSSNDNNDNNGLPATPGETGGKPSDEYKEFLNALPF